MKYPLDPITEAALARVRKIISGKENKPMAKRINVEKTRFLIVLDGKWKILAYEDGIIWLCKREYDSRKQAMSAAWGGFCLANSEGWLKVGNYLKLFEVPKSPVVTPPEQNRPITDNQTDGTRPAF